LELALAANPDLSAAGRELEAVDATIVQARTRPNPDLSTLIEDTLGVTQTTTIQLNQPIELGGKRAARIGAAARRVKAGKVSRWKRPRREWPRPVCESKRPWLPANSPQRASAWRPPGAIHRPVSSAPRATRRPCRRSRHWPT